MPHDIHRILILNDEEEVRLPGQSGRTLDQMAMVYGYEPADPDESMDELFLGYTAHECQPTWLVHCAHGLRYKVVSHEYVMGERVWMALAELRDCTESIPSKMSGVPVFKGTRFTVGQLLAELADGRKTAEIADAFAVQVGMIEQFLYALSGYLNRPFST